MAKRQEPKPVSDDADDCDRPEGGPGASDANSGAGNATGAPDADTGMRAEGAVNQGDVEHDREKLFPDAPRSLHKDTDDDTRE